MGEDRVSPFRDHSARRFSSPEVLISAPWNAAADFWNLTPPDGHYKVRFDILEIVDLFWPFPRSFLQKGGQELVQGFLDNERGIKWLPPLERAGLESEEFLSKLGGANRREFVMLLSSLMTIDPE